MAAHSTSATTSTRAKVQQVLPVYTASILSVTSTRQWYCTYTGLHMKPTGWLCARDKAETHLTDLASLAVQTDTYIQVTMH